MCRVLAVQSPLETANFDAIRRYSRTISSSPNSMVIIRWEWLGNGQACALHTIETSLFILSLSKKRKEWKRVSDGLCLMSGVRPRRFSLLPLAPLFTTSFNENLTHRQTHRHKNWHLGLPFDMIEAEEKRLKSYRKGERLLCQQLARRPSAHILRGGFKFTSSYW